jgi:hypothetical protein
MTSLSLHRDVRIPAHLTVTVLAVFVNDVQFVLHAVSALLTRLTSLTLSADSPEGDVIELPARRHAGKGLFKADLVHKPERLHLTFTLKMILKSTT